MALQDIPTFEPVMDRKSGRINRLWTRWFGLLVDRVNTSPNRIAVVQLLVQGASVGTTPFPIGTLTPGIYRVSYYVRITQPASTSSSLEVTFSWTDGGVPCAVTFAPITGNSTSTTDSALYHVRIDSSTPISYGTTYSSTGGTPMQYALHAIVETVGLEG